MPDPAKFSADRVSVGQGKDAASCTLPTVKEGRAVPGQVGPELAHVKGNALFRPVFPQFVADRACHPIREYLSYIPLNRRAARNGRLAEAVITARLADAAAGVADRDDFIDGGIFLTCLPLLRGASS